MAETIDLATVEELEEEFMAALRAYLSGIVRLHQNSFFSAYQEKLRGPFFEDR